MRGPPSGVSTIASYLRGKLFSLVSGLPIQACSLPDGIMPHESEDPGNRTMDGTGKWPAVISPASALEARRIVYAVLEHLQSELKRPHSFHGRWALINGTSGVAIVMHYASMAGMFAHDNSTAPSALDIICKSLRLLDKECDASFYFGIAGLLWVAELIGGDELIKPEPRESFEAQLRSRLQDASSPFAHGLFRGLSGIGIYCLQGWKSGRSDLADLVVKRLADSVQLTEEGAWWATDGQVVRSPLGGRQWINLGMAHGTLAPLCFLAEACNAGISGARNLTYEGGRWLRSQCNLSSPDFCFPVGIDGTSLIACQRLAWCNGELPAIFTLLQAGLATDEREWVAVAVRAGMRAARRHVSYLAETTLCHGDAGVAFVFAYLYFLTREQVFADASRRWYDSLIARREPHSRFEGYRTLLEPTWEKGPGTLPKWVVTGQFLRGAGGVALSLLAGIASTPPEWSGALMMFRAT